MSQWVVIKGGFKSYWQSVWHWTTPSSPRMKTLEWFVLIFVRHSDILSEERLIAIYSVNKPFVSSMKYYYLFEDQINTWGSDC